MKRKIANLVLVVLFAAMLVFPLVFTDFQGGQVSAVEKRTLATFPKTGEDLSPARVESWINDNIGGRSLASRTVTRVNFSLWRVSEKQNDFIGREDWIYYAPFQVQMDFIGSNFPGEAELNRQVTLIENLADTVEARGCAFAFFLLPDKKTVYPEYYMPGIEPIVTEKYTDLLTRSIQERASVDFYFLKDTLLDAKAQGILYSQSLDSSHWNSLGAYVGYQFIVEQIQPLVPNLRVIPQEEVYREEIVREGTFFGAVPLEETDYFFALGHEREVTEDDAYLDRFPELRYQGNPIAYKKRYINTTSEDLPKLLFVGDSYSIALLPFISQSFQEVTFLHIAESRYLEDLMESIAPDIVLFEAVERSLPALFEELPIYCERGPIL